MKTSKALFPHRLLLLLSLLSLSCGSGNPVQQAASQPQLTNSECDDPDAPTSCCFLNMPELVSSVLQISGSNEPGTPMKISGIVYKSDGKTPWPGVLLYAYHTDNTGHYSKNGNEKGVHKWHGKLHGWLKTDAQGRYEIKSIRPAPYPGNQGPAHVHKVVKLPVSGEAFYIGDFIFDDDPAVQRMLKSAGNNMLNRADVVSLKMTNGVWVGTSNVIVREHSGN